VLKRCQRSLIRSLTAKDEGDFNQPLIRFDSRPPSSIFAVQPVRSSETIAQIVIAASSRMVLDCSGEGRLTRLLGRKQLNYATDHE
jgi:hypothetical protein